MAFKVNSYYYTDWQNKQDLHLKLESLNLDTAYENFIRQIAGDKLQNLILGESLKESVARLEQKELLQRQILALESKILKYKLKPEFIFRKSIGNGRQVYICYFSQE